MNFEHCANLLLLSEHDMTSWVLPFLKATNHISLLVQAWIPYLTDRFRFHLRSKKKLKETVSFLPSSLLMISKLMLHFELHPNILGNNTKILENEKSVLITLIKAPVIFNVEYYNLKKINVATMWNSLKYCNNSVYLSLCRSHFSEYHYNILQKYFAKSALPDRHVFFLLLENLRMRSKQFWFLLILCQKSSKNYHSLKLK